MKYKITVYVTLVFLFLSTEGRTQKKHRIQPDRTPIVQKVAFAPKVNLDSLASLQAMSHSPLLERSISETLQLMKVAKKQKKDPHYCGYMEGAVDSVTDFLNYLDVLSGVSCFNESQKKQLATWSSNLNSYTQNFHQIISQNTCTNGKAVSPEQLQKVEQAFNDVASAFSKDWPYPFDHDK